MSVTASATEGTGSTSTASSRSVTSARTWALATVVFVAALLPRVLDPDRFSTIDEAMHWLYRSSVFFWGLAIGHPGDTAPAPHPGVITMWCGAVGIALDRLLVAVGLRADPVPFDVWRETLRLPIEVLHAALASAGFLSLRRLVGERVALLAALFWAADPFLIAHGRVLHVDAAASELHALALFAAIAVFRPGNTPTDRAAAGAGVIAALAVLAKISTVIIAPEVVGLAVVASWPSRPRWRPLVVWAAAGAVTALVVWPAVWSNPIGVVEELVWGVELGTSPHELGNYFLGQPVDDPGWLFYPVAVALRAAPWMLVGVAVAAVETVRRWRAPSGRFSQASPEVLIGLAAMLFLAFVSLQAKKFDRYALPAFPLLDVYAAAGLVAAWDAAATGLPALRRLPAGVGWGLVVAGLGGALATIHPSYLAYYDPLLGGGRVAEKAILVGWGEGTDTAFDWIREQGGCDGRIAVAHAITGTADAARCGQIVELAGWRRADFAVLYVSERQRQHQDAYVSKITERDPALVVTLAGIDYVEVYDLRRRKAPARR